MTYDLTALDVAELFEENAIDQHWMDKATRANVYEWARTYGLPHKKYQGATSRLRDGSKPRLRFNKAQVLQWWRDWQG